MLTPESTDAEGVRLSELQRVALISSILPRFPAYCCSLLLSCTAAPPQLPPSTASAHFHAHSILSPFHPPTQHSSHITVCTTSTITAMGQSLSHTSGAAASRIITTMGKRITAPANTAETQSAHTATSTATLSPAAIRTQLKHVTAALNPQLVDAIKRRDEAAIGQFEALHSQLSALYSSPSLPDEYEVRVHELWRKAETLRTAMNVVEGLKERGRVQGRVDVGDMEGEDERDKQREQARMRVEEVEEQDRQQRRRSIELQKLAARRAAERKTANLRQSKLTGKVSKARKNGPTTNRPQLQQKKRKAAVEEEEEEDDAEAEKLDSDVRKQLLSDGAAAGKRVAQLVAALEADDGKKDEETHGLPSPKKSKPTSRFTRTPLSNDVQQSGSQSVSKAAKQTTIEQPLSLSAPTLASTADSMPKTYTRMSAAVNTTAATPNKDTTSARPVRQSPRKQPAPSLHSTENAIPPAATDSFVTPVGTGGTTSKHKQATAAHAANEDSGKLGLEQRRPSALKPPSVANQFNLSRVTAAMTPERKKAQQRLSQQQQAAEVKEMAGPGVGRTGKRRRSAMVAREREQDIYDTFGL